MIDSFLRPVRRSRLGIVLLASLAIWLALPASAAASSECDGGLLAFPDRSPHVTLLRSNATENCLHWQWLHGDLGLSCYLQTLSRQLSETYVYSFNDTYSRYADCVAVALGEMDSDGHFQFMADPFDAPTDILHLHRLNRHRVPVADPYPLAMPDVQARR